MAFNEQLNDRIREMLANHEHVEEKRMFGGSCFMVNEKMCVGIVGDELMCRIGPEAQTAALAQPYCREMDFAGKPMEGYVYVALEGLARREQLQHWVNLCLAFNPKAKASKKKK